MAKLVRPSEPRFRNQAEEALCAALAFGLPDAFVVCQARSASGIVCLHPDLGAMALVTIPAEWRLDEASGNWVDQGGNPVDSPNSLASAAAAALSEACGGIPMTAVAVALREDASDGVLAAPLDRIPTAVALAMDKAAHEPLGRAGIVAVTEHLTSAAQAAVSQNPPQEIDRMIVRMIEACVENVLGERRIFVAGVELRSHDVAGPSFMLPAILIAAAEAWAPVVVSRDGEGGFHVRLTPDPQALLGYRVSEVTPSASLLLFLPIVNLVRKSIEGSDCNLDGAVDIFARWLKKNQLDAEIVEDIEIRVVASV